MTSARALAIWTSPAAFAAIAAAVFGGEPDAAWLVVAVLVAPLVALVQGGPAAPRTSHPVAAVVDVVAAGLVLWASLLVLAELAPAVRLARGQVVGAAAALALLLPAWAAARRWAVVVVLVALGALVVPIAALWAGPGGAPWRALADIGARSALRFVPGSEPVTRGHRIVAPSVLDFSESHRVTALTAGTYRVVERDAPALAAGRSDATIVREWRLSAGETLTLRPGDRLAVAAGTQVRFEAGKRVPGIAASGVTWADPPARGSPHVLLAFAGVAVTLVGGALALVRPAAPLSPAARTLAPALLAAFVLVAGCWGVYGMSAAPQLALAAPDTARVLELAAVALGSGSGLAVGVVALVAAFAGTALALRERVLEALSAPGVGDRFVPTPSRLPLAVWSGLVAAVAAASLWPGDPWHVLLAGLGLAAAGGAAPALAAGTRARAVAGSVIGAGAFAVLAGAASVLPPWAAGVASFPALVAAPLAWLVARGPSRRDREAP
jgi:hypothetical protein